MRVLSWFELTGIYTDDEADKEARQCAYAALEMHKTIAKLESQIAILRRYATDVSIYLQIAMREKEKEVGMLRQVLRNVDENLEFRAEDSDQGRVAAGTACILPSVPIAGAESANGHPPPSKERADQHATEPSVGVPPVPPEHRGDCGSTPDTKGRVPVATANAGARPVVQVNSRPRSVAPGAT